MVGCVDPGQINASVTRRKKKKYKMTHEDVLGSINYPYKFYIQDFFICYEPRAWQCVVFTAVFKTYVCTCIGVYIH